MVGGSYGGGGAVEILMRVGHDVLQWRHQWGCTWWYRGMPVAVGRGLEVIGVEYIVRGYILASRTLKTVATSV